MVKNNQHKISFSLTLKNIGKHQSLDFKEGVNSLRIALYAMNGSGKTFISRAFRLVEMQNYSEEDMCESINKINKLISFGKDKASIALNIKSDSFDDELEIELIKDCGIKFNKKSNYYFHVFNSDYVRENIEIKKYELSENVNGYILGKDKIELSNEYDKKLKLESRQKELRQQIEYVLNEGTKDLLSKFQISPLLNEYKNITFDTIINDKEQENDSNLDFSYLLNEYTNIANKLGDYQDIESIDCTSIDDISFIDEIQKKLKEKYLKSNFTEDFVKKISNKGGFIELGLRNMKQDTIHCPFCEQKLNDNAKKLIYDYNKFLDAKEIEILNFLIGYEEQLNKYKDKIVEYKDKFYDIHKKYDNLKLYFNQKKLKDFISLDEKYINGVSSYIDEILKEIYNKRLDISREINIEECVCKFKDTIKKIIDICEINTRSINQINKLKREPRGYIKYLRKSACEAKLIDIKKQLKSNIGEYNNIYMKLQSIQQKIQEEENKINKDRKKAFMKCFKKLLILFFQEKYIIDDNFCLHFKNSDIPYSLNGRTIETLSEGEKSTIAFCYYIAEVCLKYKYKQFENLFFIIDDPISSMDYHYVYSVAKIIKDCNVFMYNNNKKKNPRVRFLILTHNVDFYNTLIRNRISNDNFILENGKIMKINENKYILPYIEQLKEIYKISKGKEKPKYHTANSIRNVLESVGRFFYPTADLHNAMQELGLMEIDNILYNFINDGSHGGYASQKPITDTNIKGCCEKLIEVLRDKISGQIEMIEKEIKDN
ncbi:hypothetical protein BOP98_07330 [Campylobacter coli]|nr:hypothetical protein BOP98_07330 [Campylobacter coli]